MSNRRGSVSDYPEHLNPFYEGNEKLRFWKFGRIKRSGSFGESLRNTLTLKSFRGKKKDKQAIPSSPPEIRKQAPIIPPRQRQTLPATLSPIYSPRNTAGPALPRSRFSERVGNSSLRTDDVSDGHNISPTFSHTPAPANPFEQDEKLSHSKPKLVRRRKRRAPLPPNMTREEGDDPYLGVSSRHNFSKWSLTSVETDISTYSENENLSLDAVNQEMSEIMSNITKEMEKMTTDTSSNDLSPTKEIHLTNDHSEVPDLIASSTEGMKREEIDKPNEMTSIDVTIKHVCKEHPTDENSNVVSKIAYEHVKVEKMEYDKCEDKIQMKTEAFQDVKSEENIEHVPNNKTELGSEEEEITIENSNDNGSNNVRCEESNDNVPNIKNELESNSCDVSTNKSSLKEEELKNVNNNCDENEDTASKEEDDKLSSNILIHDDASAQDLNFNERKSIYINASNDQLNKYDSSTEIDNAIKIQNVDINENEKVSPLASPRCKTEINLIVNEGDQKGEKDNDDKKDVPNSPIPKTRTNKLSKSELLGNELTEN